jgi:poly(3-hydroxybutyrate) depolymerase
MKSIEACLILVILLAPHYQLNANQPNSLPSISREPQSQAIFIGASTSLSINATGTTPIFFQWRRDTVELANQTNSILKISRATLSDDGDYDVIVSNSVGLITNKTPARVYVVPARDYLKANFTNSIGKRLPYFYKLPAAYGDMLRFPLVLYFHGNPGDENIVPNPGGYFESYAAFHIFSSPHQESRDPAIVVWPCRRSGDALWTPEYVRHSADLVEELLTRFQVDTNRIYVSGQSAGVQPAWDLVALRPALFAAARFASGSPGNASPPALAGIPTWVTCAQDDGTVSEARRLVQSLLTIGNRTVYTEYATGGHLDAIAQAWYAPITDWLLENRRDQVQAPAPFMRIASPDQGNQTARMRVSLSGDAFALNEPLSEITWKNLSTGDHGTAIGTRDWSIQEVPLKEAFANKIIVNAVTSSWAPLFKGTTTISATITILNSPIKAQLSSADGKLLLSWTSGEPPYIVEFAPILSADRWQILSTNALPPFEFRQSESTNAFFRISNH